MTAPKPLPRMPGAAAAVSFRSALRGGRLQALADAEGFAKVLVEIDQLGAYLSNNPNSKGMSAYAEALTALVIQSGSDGDGFAAALEALRIGRNDAMHEGAAARRMTSQAVEVALRLEEALNNIAKPPVVEHYMMPNPTCAEPWQTMKVVRRTMLAHQFSYVPVLWADTGTNPSAPRKWRLISDYALAQYLLPQRRARMNVELADALAGGLRWVDAPIAYPDDETSITFATNEHLPRLVLDRQDHLLGIITAFDIL